MRPSIVLLIFIVMLGCSEQHSNDAEIGSVEGTPPASTIVSFERLLGEWQDELDTVGTTFHEHWTTNADGSFIGLGFVLSGKDTVFIEHLAIIPTDTGAYYSATIGNQNDGAAVHFPMVHQKDSLVFTDPSHDYPQRIVYAPGPDDDWVVTVSGTVKGESTMDRFHFTRRHSSSSIAH